MKILLTIERYLISQINVRILTPIRIESRHFNNAVFLLIRLSTRIAVILRLLILIYVLQTFVFLSFNIFIKWPH